MRRFASLCLLTILFAVSIPLIASAGIKVYENGDRYVETGGTVQVQYRYINPTEGPAVDDILMRRLRPYLMGTVTKDWVGKIEFDFGASLDENEVAVKDAYMQYKGLRRSTLTIGNAKPPFSREFLTSSKRILTVDRTFVGDHNVGTPDRALGLVATTHTEDTKLEAGAAVGSEDTDPSVSVLDFDTPVNRMADWNQGWLASGRVGYYPMGSFKYNQVDYRTEEFKVGLGGGAYYWWNDGDLNSYTQDDSSTSTSKADLDLAYSFEVDGALRGRGLSVDAEYHYLHGETVVKDFTGGLFQDGQTDVDIYSLVGGYTFPGERIGVAAAWELLDGTGYETGWQKTTLGLNWFLNEEHLKVQANYVMGRNVFGIDGNDSDNGILQFQFVY